MKNCSNTREQLAFMATNTSQDAGRSVLGHITNRTRRINCHMSLSSNLFSVKPIKNRFISPIACPSRNSARTISFIPFMYGNLLPGRTDILFDPSSDF
ncbi:hypothetical protein TNCV_2804231 [Trichonephila clavipes]|nr:hypothetical protein TNCV_2804231 [Trichonephila clavipes]